MLPMLLPNRILAGLVGLALLDTGGAALAQSTGAATAPALTGPTPAGARYAAAHDSLMRRVAGARAQAEERSTYFNATKGSFGGLHRRIKSYAGVGKFIVKQQIVRQRNGTELEKVTYYDTYGRKVLAERYEGRLLTRLELVEYSNASEPVLTDRWLLVRGDYLRHDLAPTTVVSPTGERSGASQQTSYFFRALPAGQ